MPWPGVHVVAKVPCAGPVPPPSMEVTPDISASPPVAGRYSGCGVEAAGGEDLALAAITSVPGPMMMVTLG